MLFRSRGLKSVGREKAIDAIISDEPRLLSELQSGLPELSREMSQVELKALRLAVCNKVDRKSVV